MSLGPLTIRNPQSHAALFALYDVSETLVADVLERGRWHYETRASGATGEAL